MEKVLLNYKNTSAMEVGLLNIKKRFQRAAKRLIRPNWMRRLEQSNESCSKSLLDPRGPKLSLTSCGERINSAFYTLESIGQGQLRPSQLNLWLDKKYENSIPQTLERLTARGLQLKFTDDLGPHTKYFPEINSELCDTLVTADDDVLYPSHWLQTLSSAHIKDPDSILCFRAKTILLEDSQDKIASYASWPECRSTVTSPSNFFTGVCGVLYPRKMQQALRMEQDKFLSICPKADDIWLNLVALRHNIPTRQIVPVPAVFYEIPGTRQNALANYNNGQGGNDIQISQSYTREDIQRLKDLLK
jgi:hypothetical protein